MVMLLVCVLMISCISLQPQSGHVMVNGTIKRIGKWLMVQREELYISSFYTSRDQVKEGEMGGVCSTHGEKWEVREKLFFLNPDRRYNVGESGMGVMIKLKRII